MDNCIQVNFHIRHKHPLLDISVLGDNINIRAKKCVVSVRIFPEHSEHPSIHTDSNSGADIQLLVYFIDKTDNSVLES